MLEIYDCKTEYREDPRGIDAKTPRFSWKLRSDRQNVIQSFYQISVFSEGREIWNSGRVESDRSRNVKYQGPELKSRQKLSWRISLSDGLEDASGRENHFEMGLLEEEDWSDAEWITSEGDIDYDAYKPSPYLRREFRVKAGLKGARIYQTAHGLYQFWINGKPGTEDKFNPGFTSYQMRIQYQTYDITDKLREGGNVWAVQLADGWWRGNTGGGNRNNYGFKLAFLGQIVLEYEDGSLEVVGTNEEFKTSTSPLLKSDMKIGDTYDAGKEMTGWMETGFDDSAWKACLLCDEFNAKSILIPSRSLPVREKEHFEGKVFRDPRENLLIDFSQNIAGYVKMKLRNTRPGQRIVFWHGEGLRDGVFSTSNIHDSTGEPFQQVVYLCKGGKTEEYCPWSAVFGFRYVKIEGYDESLIQPGDFQAIALYSDLKETGDFSCSNELINRLVKNSRWSQKGNFLDVPTDCPTRERSSWSGDGQVYCKTATDFMDAYPFYEKWLGDLNLEQFENGCVGNTFPSTNALHNPLERKRMIDQGRFIFAPPTLAGPKGEGALLDGAAGWGDAATIIPVTMYLCYGDRQILEQQYQSAKKWSLYQRRCAEDHNPLYEDQPQYHTENDGILDANYIFDTKYHWGEWLEPDAPENAGPESFNPPEIAKKGRPVIATAFLYYSSCLVAQMAEILGNDKDAKDFRNYAAQVKRVYNKYFIQEDGTIEAGRQAAYARTLYFGLAEEDKKAKVAEKLAEAVIENDYHLNTGFLSTPFLLSVLVDNGHSDLAFRLLEQTDHPSWLHPITLGATTILENWGGLDDYMGSFNHYSYGAVSDFLFSGVAGIRPMLEAPGYKRFEIRPVTGGDITRAEAVFESPYGLIKSAWHKTGDGIRVQIEIPANTTADVYLPGKKSKRPLVLGSGKYEYFV